MQNFFGKDPIIWWIGQVTDPSPEKGDWEGTTERHHTKENPEEPIYTWRCRVRIVGYHDNAEDLPDKELPMAHVLMPPGESTVGGEGSTMNYQGGEVVVGFFADGEDALQPIVFGTLFRQEYQADQVSTGLFNKKNQDDFVPWTPPKVIEEMAPHQITEASVKPSGSGVPPASGTTNATAATSTIGPVSAQKDGPHRTSTFTGIVNKTLTDKHVSVEGDNKIQNRVPCEGNEVARIKVAINEFKEKTQSLKKIAAFDKHLDPTFGTTFNMAEEGKLVAGKIHDAMTSQVRRARAFTQTEVLGELKKTLQDKTPKTLQAETGAASQNLMDVVFCNFENVVEGLKDYLFKSLENMVGQALDVPQCAVENFLGDAFAQAGNILDTNMGDMFKSLGNITGGALGGAGGMPSDLMEKGLVFADMALEVLECDGVKCPPPTTYSARNGTFTGLTDDMTGILANMALSKLNLPEVAGTSSPDCSTNVLKCGPPRIDYMGGNGKGVSARAVVNTFGQVIGASIFNSGYGYKSPPLMNFVDSCDNGYGASGYPVIGPVSQITNANNVGINQAGGIPLFSQDGRPILAGGAGGTQVTTTKGENVYAGGQPVKAGPSGGLPVTAGGDGGEKARTSTCTLVIGGEGGVPVMVGETPLMVGSFPITCGGESVAEGVWVSDPTGLESGVINSVIIDPGQQYLPNTVQTTLDTDPNSPSYGQTITSEVFPNPMESYDGEASYVTELDIVRVKNSGMGYSPNDTVTVVSDSGTGAADTGTGTGVTGTGTGTGGGTGGAQVSIQVEDGVIVNATVVSGGSGFTSLPRLQINSDSGLGAKLLPVLKFTKVPDAEKKANESPRNVQLVTVIDCVQH